MASKPYVPTGRPRGRPRKIATPAAPETPPQPEADIPAVAAPQASAPASEPAPGGLSGDILSILADPKLKQALEYEVRRKLSFKRLEQFRPYPVQQAFYDATRDNGVVLLLAANRVGKSYSAAAMMAYHLTGHYPEWWTGHRFKEPIKAWACGLTAEVTRDIQQNELIGPPSREADWGTGLIPKDAIGPNTMLRGVASAMDTISIKHASGGWSTLSFKAFAQGRERFQGTAQHLIWLDEEAPIDVFTECVMRTATTDGRVILTFTPLNGLTPLVKEFLSDKPPGRVIRATLDDALHFSAEKRAQMIAQMLPHEREARARGEPSLGSGAIFPISEEEITCDPRPIPSHWPLLGSIDFGFSHETGAIRLAWDRDSDTVYVTHCHKAKEKTPNEHAGTLRSWGKGLPFVYPHDGDNRERGSGTTVADMYREAGLNFGPSAVKFVDGGNSVEAGIEILRERFLTGRLKIFKGLNDLLVEIRRYHRKDGRIVKTDDHLLDALRYGCAMGLRYAEVPNAWGSGPLKRNARRLV